MHVERRRRDTGKLQAFIVVLGRYTNNRISVLDCTVPRLWRSIR
jgi:hypothetical protein